MKQNFILTSSLALLVFSAAALAEVTTTNTNNGNLVMQDIPEIPASNTVLQKVWILNLAPTWAADTTLDGWIPENGWNTPYMYLRLVNTPLKPG